MAKPRGELLALRDGWAKILHEEARRQHPCWVPLERVLTITELDAVIAGSAARDGGREAATAPKDRSWFHSIDEFAVSVHA